MSNFFLQNQSLNTANFDDFKNGVMELMKIDRKQNHEFYRNDSCYNLLYFSNDIYPNLNDIDVFNIYSFFAKLSPCEVEVQNENEANLYCNSEMNGFIGIDFSNINISDHKKINNDLSYKIWNSYYESKFEKLKNKLINAVSTSKFIKSFNELDYSVQDSIISKFDDAIKQNCIINPEGNIVKDVSNSKSCKVLELRVFSPVALRVYFNYKNDIFYLASIEQKSNPNQSQDINNAEKLLLHLASKVI